MALVFDRGIEGLDVECAIRLEAAAPHLVQFFEALSVNDLEQLLARERFAFERAPVDLPFAHQHGGAALEHARESRGAKEHAHHQPVDGEQPECADDAARNRIVFANDGVLHGVGKRKQHHQVEGVELRQLALAENTEQDD